MWNYRLVKDGPDDFQCLTVAEVYYNEDGEPYGWIDATIIGDDLKETKEVHRMMVEAFDKPILEAKEIIELGAQPDGENK